MRRRILGVGRRAASQPFVVGSHNIMDGLFLPAILSRYRQHQSGPHAMHALCIQEVVSGALSAIASTLGRRFVVASHVAEPRLGIVYDRTRLRLRELRVVSLPRLRHMPAWQRLYSRLEKKVALVGLFQRRGVGQRRWRGRVTVANFHLDTAGDNVHRAAQLRSLAAATAPSDMVILILLLAWLERRGTRR